MNYYRAYAVSICYKCDTIFLIAYLNFIPLRNHELKNFRLTKIRLIKLCFYKKFTSSNLIKISQKIIKVLTLYLDTTF